MAESSRMSTFLSLSLLLSSDLECNNDNKKCVHKGLFTQSDRLCRATKNRIDPIFKNCVVQHFQMVYIRHNFH
jgi:5-methylthioribose kinase